MYRKARVRRWRCPRCCPPTSPPRRQGPPTSTPSQALGGRRGNGTRQMLTREIVVEPTWSFVQQSPAWHTAPYTMYLPELPERSRTGCPRWAVPPFWLATKSVCVRAGELQHPRYASTPDPSSRVLECAERRANRRPSPAWDAPLQPSFSRSPPATQLCTPTATAARRRTSSSSTACQA
jgi:hypothetical protein